LSHATGLSRRLAGSLVFAFAMLVAGAAVASAAKPSGPSAPRVITAKKVVRVAPAGKEPVLLEGGAFGPSGDFYFVNALAPAGTPKVLRLNLKTKHLTSLYTDSTATFTSAQFDPRGGRLYLTDFGGGAIDSLNADGSDFRVDFAGKVDGRGMSPDDIAFDPGGNLFLTDSTGTPWDPTGRVIRFGPGATDPTVLMSGLASPNGISFDSDAAGNVYQCIYEDGKILVWGERGELKAEIVIPQNLGKPELAATNLGIKPGTKRGYIVVGGESGGFVYSFKALGKGISLAGGGTVGSDRGS
jgi:lactonase